MTSARQRLTDAPISVWFLVGFIAFSVGEVATLLFVGLPPDPMVLTTALIGGVVFATVVSVVIAVIRRRRRSRSLGAAVASALRQQHLPTHIDQAAWLGALRRRQVFTVLLATVIPLALIVLAIPGVFIAQNADELRAGFYWAVVVVLVLAALVIVGLLVRRFLAIRTMIAALASRRERAERRTR